MIRAIVAALVLISVVRPAHAAEPPVSEVLEESDKRYGELDYRAAAELGERAAKDPRATEPEQARGWERVGISWLVLGQRTLAREAFDRLFTLEPTRDLADPSLSPRQREFIEEARKAHPPAKVEPKPLDLAPVVPRVEPPPPRPVWKRWYVWTAVGIGVVGLGVGLGLGLGLPGAPSGSLPPGTISLGLRF